MAENKLYYGDNLHVMAVMPKYSVDLIYLDPPFKSDQTYNLIYSQYTGRPVPEQAEAFCDTWDMDVEKEKIAKTMPMLLRDSGVEDYYVEFWRYWMQALRHTQPHLLAYLIYMVERLCHMKVLLKPTGSIYLHCDPEASHYIKVMMDGIFGHRNFRNEIVWKRTSAHSSAKRYGPVHDVVLYYTMSDKYTWNPLFTEYDERYVRERFREDEEGRSFKDSDATGSGVRHGETGKPWRGFDPTDKGRHWAYPPAELEEMHERGDIFWPKKAGGWPRLKQYVEDLKGIPIQDVWTDVFPINSQSKERLGYPTQKPVGLLHRIIRASTNEGDVVFDPFCGCGTTIYAAHETGRRWMGCDVAILAVRLVEEQLEARYGLKKGEHYHESGIPNSVESAAALFGEDPFQFEHWAVEYVGGFPTKKTADKGVDGRIYFETRDELGVMVLSVKGGAVRPTDVRDLIGVLSTEQGSELAGFISLQEPSKAMRQAAAKAGDWEYRGVSYPRVQFLTVREILEDKREFHCPTKVGAKTTVPQTVLPLRV